jgi:PAS domain S-box-containing protein
MKNEEKPHDGNSAVGTEKGASDGTKILRIQTILADRIAELEAVLAAQQDVVFIYDTGMNVRQSNPAFRTVFGFDPVGLNLREIIGRVSCRDQTGRPLVLEEQPTPRALRGERVVGSCFLVKRANGSECVVETSSGPIQVGETIVGTVTVWHDITERKRIEEALGDAQKRTATVLNNIADTYYSLDNDWRFSSINSAAEHAPFGRPASEMLGKSIWDLYPHLVGTRIQRHYFDAAEKRRLEHYEAQSPLNGLWYEVFMQGHEHGVDVFMRDVTDRRNAEEALKQSERLYRAIGESIDFGVWVCEPDGKNIYASDSFLKLVGITQEQCSNFGWGDVLHPDDAEKTITAWKECVRTGGTWNIEHRFKGVDGQWRPILARGIPVRDEQGEIIRWAGINLDISDIKRAQEALKISELNYRRLFEAAKDGILILDFDTGLIVDVNKFLVDLLEYPYEDLMRKHLWDIGVFKDVVASKESFTKLQDKEFIRYENLPLETKSGKKRAVEFVSNVYLVDKKKVIQCNIRDITERRRAEEEIVRRSKELKSANEELVRFNRAMVDRELRMIELKREINEFCLQTGKPPRYTIDLKQGPGYHDEN